MQPRAYQQAAIDATLSWVRYKTSPAIIVLPTGGGKTIVIKELAKHFATQNMRVLILAHRKELLLQTGDKFDNVGFSYYSASIEKGNLDDWVVVAGIQSIANADCAQFDVIIVDECHRMPNDGSGLYWQVINKHKGAKIIGLTATPMRTDSGTLKWGELVYNIEYKALLDAGYLAPLTNKVSAEPELGKVKISMGDYAENQLEKVMIEKELIDISVKKIISYSQNRKSVLIFCVSVMHAKILTAELYKSGVAAVVLSGETPDAERDNIIDDFKNGIIKFLVNCMILLEGFDAPNVDMVVCLRPTKSRVLWWQMMGRGVRKAENKENCLLIDMAGNLREHGGMGAPFFDVQKKSEEKKNGKICPKCEEFLAFSARECPCGYQFPEPERRGIVHSKKHDDKTDAVYVAIPDMRYFVNAVKYNKHIKKETGSVSLRVDYYCDGANYGKISEWIPPFKAHQFFLDRGVRLASQMSATTIDEIVAMADALKRPTHILVKQEGKWQRVIDYTFPVISEDVEPETIEEFLDDEIPF
jgi:DNA repair protein RadD